MYRFPSIVVNSDHSPDTSATGQPPFAMAGDKTTPDDVIIPSLFLYSKEGGKLVDHLTKRSEPLIVRMCTYPIAEGNIFCLI